MWTELFRLDGQVVVVPGGNGGIGSVLCRAFSESGASVVIAGRRLERCQEVAAQIKAHGGRALAVRADLTHPEEAERLMAAAVEHFGRLDILVNCVGGNARYPAEEYPLAEWQRILDLNLTTTLLACQAAARHMIPHRQGKILNISSVRSLLGIHSGYSAYCAAKGAVNMLTKQLATEWARYNITVNAIAPTFIRTEQVADMLADQAFYDSLVRRIPLGRVGEVDDLIGAALLFVSSASRFITGQVLFIDGGLTACQ
jgi:NAD(P)-dependent dehydrogenase (short-subunit alcohol dehydrogenase family)